MLSGADAVRNPLDGAGYPELGAAWSISRQGARKKWPFAARRVATREQVGPADDTVVCGEMSAVWGLVPELMIEQVKESPHYAGECGCCLAADGYYTTQDAARTDAEQHAHHHEGGRTRQPRPDEDGYRSRARHLTMMTVVAMTGQVDRAARRDARFGVA